MTCAWRWDELIERALAAHPPRAGKQAPARNLALRLRDRREEFLHFTTDFTVTFSNNTAEQAIRMIKVKTKVSGGFRTLCGAATFLADTRLHLHRPQERRAGRSRSTRRAPRQSLDPANASDLNSHLTGRRDLNGPV